MFQSQYFLSKKGPLASVWVAAYCPKRLRRDQIVQTHVPSSVDKILVDEWPSVAYRILGYLLLGVVRIYSKKVEFLLNDYRVIINDLNKFVGKKKAVPFREIVNTLDFSVTLPERYELDAFVLEYADDLNNAHTAIKEDIIIQGSFQYEKSIKKCSVRKSRGDVTVEETTIRTVSKTSTASITLKGCSSAQSPPESPGTSALAHVGNCTSFGSESCSSQLVRSIEEFRKIRFSREECLDIDMFSREECLDIDMFYQNDREHFGSFTSPNIIQGSNIEHSEFIKMMQTERSAIFDSEVEDETETVERFCDLTTPSDNLDHVGTEEKEANFTLETSPNLNTPSNNRNCSAVENEGNFTDRSPDLEITLDDHIIVTAGKRAITAESERTFLSDTSIPLTSGKEKLHVEVQSTPDDHKGVAAGKNVTIMDLERVKRSDISTPLASGQEKPPLKVDTTPDSKVSVAKEPGSTGRFSVRTPAIKESSARKTNKRKCIYDEVTVLSNQAIKHTLDDTSDLVRKRRRLPHASLALWRLSCDLPQKLLEPSIPCNTGAEIVMGPEGVQKKPNDVSQDKTVETVEAPNAVDEVTVLSNLVLAVSPLMAVSPPRIVPDVQLETIAPGTPVLCSTSSRAFVTPRAADSDGEGPFLQTATQESPCQSFENATRDIYGDSAEKIALNLMDQDMDQDGDFQKLDGWSTRTRTIATWLHQVFTSKKKCKEAQTANLSQILDGKLKKESALVFYEILVLGSGQYVNVSQEGAYKDILLQETCAMERKLAKCAV